MNESMKEPVKILRMKEGSGRYFVLLSGRERAIVVSEELVHRHRLKEGIVVTAPQLAQLESEAELAECDRVIVRLLALREHSIGEIRSKLARRKFGPQVIQATVKKYVDRGLLDDAHFAQSVAHSLVARNPVGRAYLVAYLQQKMVSREIAEETADVMLQGQDETELAVKSLRKRWATYRQFEVETARTKAYTYLGRRGIGYSAAKAAFEKLRTEEEKVDDN